VAAQHLEQRAGARARAADLDVIPDEDAARG
jgi:hypothetical protein